MIKNEDRQLFRPFGPTVGKTKIPEDIVKKINDYVDELVKDDVKAKKYDAGKYLAGNVTQEFDLDQQFAKDCGWLEFLSRECAMWIESSTGKKIKKFHLIGTWIVRQIQNEYNPIHYHGGHISGVGYLKVPKDLGQFTQKEKDKYYIGGRLQLIHGSKMFMSPSTVNLTPKVGDFYFFPNYLMHTVFPFKNSNEERRSVSFNAKIDANIYNVYGG